MGAAGFADYGVGLEEDVAGGEVGVLEALEHGGHGHGADVGAVLVLGGERDGEEGGVLDVVDADDADVLGDADAFGGETGHDAGCGEVVGADDAVGAALVEELLEEGRVFGIAEANEVFLQADASGEERFAIARNARDDGGGGEWLADEDDAPGSVAEEMLGDEEASLAVIDSDEIVFRTHGVRSVAAVKEDDGDAGAVESGDDAGVDGVLGWGELKRCEEDAGDLLGDVLLAELLGFLLLLRCLAHGVAP